MVSRFLRIKQRQIARERVRQLIEFAKKISSKNIKRSDHYIKLARKIAMKARIRIAPDLKRNFCKHCYCFLKQGVNCRVRLKDNKVIYYCFKCKKYMRFPILKEKKARKKKT